MADNILLDHGSGGRASQRLIADIFLQAFDNPILKKMDDAALLEEIHAPIAMSTDGYTVDPLEFPGGNIGTLAINGTVNDLAMLGARPLYLSCACILEEGLPLEVLKRIVASIGEAAIDAGVQVVTGDTKVVPRGAADKIFITTTGIGEVLALPAPSGSRARAGDSILVSGSMGDHGLTVMSRRAGLEFDASIQSDCVALHKMTEALITEVGDIHVLRDPTRGGLATTLNEIAEQSGVVCKIYEDRIPVKLSVADGCSILGLDPLYLANEGKCICILPQAKAEAALAVMRRFGYGQDAMLVGEILDTEGSLRSGQVVLQTRLGGQRLLRMLEGVQLPRIC